MAIHRLSLLCKGELLIFCIRMCLGTVSNALFMSIAIRIVLNGFFLFKSVYRFLSYVCKEGVCGVIGFEAVLLCGCWS